MNTINKKGFTLIELLIVIGILAILAAAVIVVLNPAELLAQARDGQRLADLGSVESSMSLYLADFGNPDLNYGATGTIQTSMVGTTCGFTGTTTCVVATSTVVVGTGWVRVKLDDISGGSPISVLPTDPVNDADYHYAYAGDDVNDTWELNARLESTKHRDKMTSDGGNQNTCSTYTENTCWYESGTDQGLDL